MPRAQSPTITNTRKSRNVSGCNAHGICVWEVTRHGSLCCGRVCSVLCAQDPVDQPLLMLVPKQKARAKREGPGAQGTHLESLSSVLQHLAESLKHWWVFKE